ncbi:MAG: hypothetical protein FJ280_11555 [Planctomycetes bacterium]|nr:hypothetical protein [Planctomycetota bacterium]
MVCDARIRWMGLWLTVLAAPGLAAESAEPQVRPGVSRNLFPTEVRRQAFLRALAKQDPSYDPRERMLQAPFSSPGYHTTLTGGTVHRTRDTLRYAVALLDAGDAERLERAEQVLRRVIALQDQDPASRTYGIWSWFLEEPLDKMSPPDWNWADFCGTQLLQVALDHMDRLPPDLREQVKESILHAARSIQRRNVGPGYTNIALMGTYVTLVAGERFDVPELADYGRQRLRRFHEYTRDKGSFSEYNSPTYTIVAIEEISRMLQHVRDREALSLLQELNGLAWRHVARHFHPPTKQWAGPHSRSYATLLRAGSLAAIQRATEGRVAFLPEAEVWESLDAHRVRLSCPADFFPLFTTLPGPRFEIETFDRTASTEHDLIGTTYLHPDFTLGSVNLGDFWNQRRSLVAYWNGPDGPAALRLRCLHDGYDYASAGLFAVQDRADILGAVLFATDRGDTHISLDRIRDATITARELSLRLQFEGAVSDLRLPEKRQLDEPIRFTCGSIEALLCLHSLEFTGLRPTIEAGRQGDQAWIDIVLYRGPGRTFDFGAIAEAALVFSLSLAPARSPLPAVTSSAYRSIATDLVAAGIDSPRHTWSWPRTNQPSLSLTIPIKPLPTKQQKAAAAAKCEDTNPWKSTR